MESLGNFSPKEAYILFNSRYFGNRLPDIPVEWVSGQDYLGCSWFDPETHRPVSITLNSEYMMVSKIWAFSLVHEMVHVQQWRVPKSQIHGRKFQKRMKQLAALGAFNGLW